MGRLGGGPSARWLRVPPKTNLRSKQDDRRPGGFFARYRKALLIRINVPIASVVLLQRNELRRTFITDTPQGYRWQRLGLTL